LDLLNSGELRRRRRRRRLLLASLFRDTHTLCGPSQPECMVARVCSAVSTRRLRYLHQLHQLQPQLAVEWTVCGSPIVRFRQL
jgi:hypothetical protein